MELINKNHCGNVGRMEQVKYFYIYINDICLIKRKYNFKCKIYSYKFINKFCTQTILYTYVEICIKNKFVLNVSFSELLFWIISIDVVFIEKLLTKIKFSAETKQLYVVKENNWLVLIASKNHEILTMHLNTQWFIQLPDASSWGVETMTAHAHRR